MITTKFENFLLPEDLIFFENSPEVAIEKNRLENMNKVYFSLTLPNSIKQSLSEKFGLDLTGITKFPMTWIKGDTPHHIDVGSSSFTKTHLLYLNDNPGEFIVNDNSYSITKNTAYVFSEGLSHKTINTGKEPRLLLGPMNEFAHPVGGSIQYYASEANALIYNNMISNGYSYTVYQRHGLTFWRIASNSTGTSPQNIVYQAGDVLIGDGVYYLYSDVPVFGSLTYFAKKADALANTNSIGSDETLTVFDIGNYIEWRIASNSTGTSFQGDVYTTGAELNFDGNYYLYPVFYIRYYPTQADALAETNLIGVGINLTVETTSGYSSFRIASNSTGTSSQTGIYATGDVLNDDGNYNLYPYEAPPSVNLTYYSELSSALLTNQGSIGTSANFTLETIGDNSDWKLAPNSTGSSSQLVTYSTGDVLIDDGIYYIYPALPVINTVTYYPTEADALAYTNAGASGTYFTIVDGSCRIASNSTGSSSQLVVYNTGDLLINDGNYYLYPAEAPSNSVTYYPTQADALAGTNSIGTGASLTVETIGGFSSWRIASNSTGTSSQLSVYNTGNVLNDDGNYNLYPAGQLPCFLEGTTILCKVNDVESYLPVETIKPGTLVKTSLNGYKKVELIGKGNINNPGNNERIEKRLYKCSTNKYAELKEDLYITGCHSILVNNITDLQREQSIKQSGKVFVTDKKYRLMACIDERAEPWASEGTYTIWHVALENDNIKMNYGVYANGGLLVETCSINYMRTKANMQLIS